MALQIAKDTDSGAQASYWNIGSVQTDYRGKGLQVTFYGYVSQDTRAAGKTPLGVQQFTLVGDQYIADATRALVYDAIKAQPYFAGAVDC